MGCLKLTYLEEPNLFLDEPGEKTEPFKLKVWVNPGREFSGVDAVVAQQEGPDADGFLTKEEAIAHWRNGGGTTLNIDLSKLDLSRVYASDFGGVGSKLVFNFAFHASIYDNVFKTKMYHQGWVFGNITLKLVGPNEVRAYQDTYDFDYKSNWNPLNWPRNLDTAYGEEVNGTGTPFKININGSAFIDLKPFPVR